MVLVSGIVGTVLSVWLYYNFTKWLNILTDSAAGRYHPGTFLLYDKKDYEDPTAKPAVVNWFAVGGVILGAVVANVVNLGIASINGMVVAAVCYLIVRELPKINKKYREKYKKTVMLYEKP